jgi:hypothetical protein
MVNWTFLWQQQQHNGASSCIVIAMVMDISEISDSFKVHGFGYWEMRHAWKGYNLKKLGLYRLDMGHAETWHAMGWAGGDGRYAGWGCNVPTWHLHKQRAGLWVSRSKVMGRWGVANILDALAILLYQTYSFPLACLTSSINIWQKNVEHQLKVWYYDIWMPPPVKVILCMVKPSRGDIPKIKRLTRC